MTKTEQYGTGFTLKRRNSDGSIDERRRISQLLDNWQGERERWLFIAPHDDDVVMGAGLLLQCARAEDVAISVLITTDGSMGYCSLEDRERISEIRKRETLESFHQLGIDDVSWLNFGDGNLTLYHGRRQAAAGDPGVIEGYTGLANAYTYELRKTRPTRLFLASGNDLHPDHKSVYQEARASIFHAGGAIWPELGEPLDELPVVYELAIYCAFPSPPEYLISGSADHLERKLEAIAAYRSQKQIGRLVDELRSAGPIEYLKLSDFALYSPEIYRGLFEPEE